jgi:hypothetical protein
MTWFSWGVAGQGLSRLCFRRARGNDSKRGRLSLSIPVSVLLGKRPWLTWFGKWFDGSLWP